MRIPAYQLHKASGQARVAIGGRDVYLGPHGTEESKRRYQEAIKALQVDRAQAAAKVDAEARVANSRKLVHDLVPAYFEHCQRYYLKDGRQTSQISVIRSALRVLRRLHGPSLAATFGPLKLKACQAEFVRMGLSRPGVNKRVGLIRQFFRWAVAEEFIPGEVSHGLQAVSPLRAERTTAPEPEPVGPVEMADVEAMLPHVGPMVAAMVRIQLLTGMRPAEVCGISRDQITAPEGAIWEYRPKRHKNQHHNKGRVIVIGPQAQEVLRPYMMGGDRPFGMLTASYRRAIHRACDRAGIARWGPNRLRHTAATRVRREFGLEAARVILGHSKVETTQVYAERDLATAREAMRKVG